MPVRSDSYWEPAALSERFWKRVDKTDTCWNYVGTRTSSGYGHVYTGPNRRRDVAHRFSYELIVGPIPEGLQLDHLCRNRLCVNPEHLEPVTQRENTLRGIGFSAQNARKTRCPKGHGYSSLRADGRGRRCLACERARHARDRAAARARAKR
jgi:hypothetical protein